MKNLFKDKKKNVKIVISIWLIGLLYFAMPVITGVVTQLSENAKIEELDHTFSNKAAELKSLEENKKKMDSIIDPSIGIKNKAYNQILVASQLQSVDISIKSMKTSRFTGYLRTTWHIDYRGNGVHLINMLNFLQVLGYLESYKNGMIVLHMPSSKVGNAVLDNGVLYE